VTSASPSPCSSRERHPPLSTPECYARLESTDDAQIDGYIYPITSRVTGYAQRVTVDDNQVWIR